ncbi:diamine acetyltransferase 2-like isoform X2 [Python bivittatus]|uniref:Diamine acetyltransferase 2-like isoform X2 n=1 Tax=Python bivittatus TaxID=176946 RepID=A0A9F5N2I5_PYTBI|nr:diamine acetyltransferase 2-like isoform X2 [Python bivittatus]
MECLIRPAKSSDCETLMSFIKEIAALHNLLHEVVISAEDLKADGFGKEPFFKCLLAEAPPENAGTQDKGVGRQLLAKVVEVALAAGCTSMKFATMEGNRRAKEFYLRLGAHDTTQSEDWHCMEFGKEALQRLVQEL